MNLTKIAGPRGRQRYRTHRKRLALARALHGAKSVRRAYFRARKDNGGRHFPISVPRIVRKYARLLRGAIRG